MKIKRVKSIVIKKSIIKLKFQKIALIIRIILYNSKSLELLNHPILEVFFITRSIIF